MSFKIALYFVYLAGIVDACFLGGSKSPPPPQLTNRHKECTYGAEDSTDMEKAANFLVYQGFRTTLLPFSAGFLALDEGGQNTARVSSSCRLTEDVQNKTQYSQVYSCKVDMINVCYDYMMNAVIHIQTHSVSRSGSSKECKDNCNFISSCKNSIESSSFSQSGSIDSTDC
ncbi:hypothetical protein Aperf_G00000074001 [Anoplocephala perfoliata]